MTQETALGAALKSAVQTMSKKKQTDMIADYLYSKYDVFKRFKPLAIGIEKDLVEALPQFDAALIQPFPRGGERAGAAVCAVAAEYPRGD